MDKAKKSPASKVNENIEMRITSMIEEVLKDSSSDDEINKRENFTANKKQSDNTKNNYLRKIKDFTRLNLSEKEENCFANNARNFSLYGVEEHIANKINLDFAFNNCLKDYKAREAEKEKEFPIKDENYLRENLNKPNNFYDKKLKNNKIKNIKINNDKYDKTTQDEIKYKSSHENLFYLNNPFLLENKESKGKLNKKVFNSYANKENKNIENEIEAEKYEIKKKQIKNNSYSGNMNNLELENFEVPKKFNSDDLSNLWQSFPFRNKSNASKKSNSKEIENNDDYDNYDANELLKEKELNNANNDKSKFFTDYIKDSINHNNYKNNKGKNKSLCRIKNHFCNIDIHNKYLTKGFSFFNNPHYPIFHQNKFTNTASKEIQENLENNNNNNFNNSCISIQQPTLEELLDKIKHSERINKENIKNLRGKIINILKSQNGSRILQNSLINDSYFIIKTILTEVEDELNDLMVDPYANYFCQKLYEHLKLQDRLTFLKKINGSIKNIATNKIGTYPLQSVIDHMRNTEEKKLILSGIFPFLKEISMDSQGTHVIEKLLICFDETHNSEIINFFIENFVTFANNINSLCIVKKLIIISKNFEIQKKILEKIFKNLDNLIQNAHGNYSIQVALEVCEGFYSEPIISELSGKFHKYSLLKYSSNVVERCLEIGGEVTVNRFIEEICQKNKVLDILKNSFGNYVVQKALKLSRGHFKHKLLNYIKKSVDKITEKKLISKWTNIIEANKISEAPEKPLSRIKSNESLLSSISSSSNFSSKNLNPKKNNLDNSFNSNICSVYTCAHSCKSFHCIYGNENNFYHNSNNNNKLLNSNNINNNYLLNYPQKQYFKNSNSNNLNCFCNLNVNFNNFIGNYQNNNNACFQNNYLKNNSSHNNNNYYFNNNNKENLNFANRNFNFEYSSDSNTPGNYSTIFPMKSINISNNNINANHDTNSKNNIYQIFNSSKDINKITENFNDLIIKDKKEPNCNFSNSNIKNHLNNILNENFNNAPSNHFNNNQSLNQLNYQYLNQNTNAIKNRNNNFNDNSFKNEKNKDNSKKAICENSTQKWN